MDDDFMGLAVEAHDALLDAAHKLEGVVLKLESGQHMRLADRELTALVEFLGHAERLVERCQASTRRGMALLRPQGDEDEDLP